MPCKRDLPAPIPSQFSRVNSLQPRFPTGVKFGAANAGAESSAPRTPGFGRGGAGARCGMAQGTTIWVSGNKYAWPKTSSPINTAKARL